MRIENTIKFRHLLLERYSGSIFTSTMIYESWYSRTSSLFDFTGMLYAENMMDNFEKMKNNVGGVSSFFKPSCQVPVGPEIRLVFSCVDHMRVGYSSNSSC